MNTPTPEWVSVTEAARRAGVARGTIYAWVVEGKIPGVRAAGVGPLRIDASALVLQPVDPAEAAS